nr:MAG TPA: hypothetical protein [Caudoviricetes sp.]
MPRFLKYFLFFFKKSLDILVQVCYNNIRK